VNLDGAVETSPAHFDRNCRSRRSRCRYRPGTGPAGRWTCTPCGGCG
jgi:hypothetical protein